jgi:methionyl-tRNA synthetase
MNSENTSESCCSKAAPAKEEVSEKKEDCCKEPKKCEDNLITFDQFLNVELKVGQILEAEKIEKSNKLIKLQVNVGDEKEEDSEEPKTRQIVAGIGKHYEAENLVGRKIIVVTNLKPAKLMGVESNGMLLAASDNAGNLELVSVGNIIPAGSKVG